MMTTETYLHQGEYAQSLLAKGQAHALLLILKAKGIQVTGQDRERISTCTDIPTLDTWIGRAAVSDTLDEVFA
ncbi:hypothetical protein [Nonomuraea sp. NPDC049725]|uniref:hypothetical protein n=1 Tax=Nonomuraea sp. NPDC049725 TaxID=3154508 RepID=UPI00342F42ED